MRSRRMVYDRDYMPYQKKTPQCADNKCLQPPLAIATVPMQNWRMVYEPEQALCAGTIYPELNLPYLGIGGRLL